MWKHNVRLSSYTILRRNFRLEKQAEEHIFDCRMTSVVLFSNFQVQVKSYYLEYEALLCRFLALRKHAVRRSSSLTCGSTYQVLAPLMVKVPLAGLYLALVSILLGSLPWLGSVKPKQPRISPRAAWQMKRRPSWEWHFLLFLKHCMQNTAKCHPHQAGAGTSPSGPLFRKHW